MSEDNNGKPNHPAVDLADTYLEALLRGMGPSGKTEPTVIDLTPDYDPSVPPRSSSSPRPPAPRGSASAAPTAPARSGMGGDTMLGHALAAFGAWAFWKSSQ